mgnify:CR=1 FL=1
MCCQPAMSQEVWDERTRRLRAAEAAARARFPKACRACGAPEPFPTFLAPNEYECSDRDCCAVWREGE